jgi:hypothetical protein
MTPSHQGAVLELWRENMAALRAGEELAERYRWLYAENPAGAVDTVVTIHQPDQRVVGCASAYPRAMRVAGTDLKAGVPVDFAVARTHRTGAAALGLQRGLVAAQETPFDFFCGFPNKAALPILKRVGYKPFANARAWIKPLRANYKVQAYAKSAAITAIAAAPVNVGLRLTDGWRGRAHQRVAGGFVARADERFDELWLRARDAYAIAGERTAAYLNWRYADFRPIKYSFFYVTPADSGQLLGYVAFSRRENKVYIGDLFATDMRKTAETMLLEFASRLRAQGVDSIFAGYAGSADFERRLTRLGFIRRTAVGERSMVALTHRTTGEQNALLLDGEQWHLFDGEMDI